MRPAPERSTCARRAASAIGATARHVEHAKHDAHKGGSLLGKDHHDGLLGLALDLEPPPLPWLSVRANGPKN